MKVGILTLPLWHNYGGILQAYALQLSLQRLGYDAILMDVKRDELAFRKELLKGIKRWVNTNLFSAIEKPYYPNFKEREEISLHTRSFVRNKIKPITEHLPLSDISKYSKKFEAIIVGSDQVWRPEYCPNLNYYFLSFTSPTTIKISYAASLGTDDWRFSKDDTINCSSLLSQFKSVSVREESAVCLLKNNLNYKPIQVCDPTLLLEKEDYLNLLNEYSCNTENGGSGIFCYILDPNDSRMSNFKNISNLTGLDTYQMMPKAFDKYYKENPKAYMYPPVESWIDCFHRSDFVITDSFHGTVFSIIFNKPFIVIANTERGKTRFESLLKQFNLEERMFDSLDECSEEIFKKNIDWSNVNKIREREQNRGLSFLTSSLSQEQE